MGREGSEKIQWLEETQGREDCLLSCLWKKKTGKRKRKKMGNEHSGPYIARQLSRDTGRSEADIQAWYSEFKGECPSGYLTPQKFTELYSKVYSDGRADAFKSRAFTTFGRGDDGQIDFKDFLLVIHLTSNGQAEDKIRLMFSLYDKDNNGSIDGNEMNSVIREVYGMLAEDGSNQAKTMFDMMDMDGDGKITETEFITACMKDIELVNMLSTRV